MKRIPVLLMLFAAAALAPAQTAETAIRKTLDAQVAAWNRGDITGFMQA